MTLKRLRRDLWFWLASKLESLELRCAAKANSLTLQIRPPRQENQVTGVFEQQFRQEALKMAERSGSRLRGAVKSREAKFPSMCDESDE